MSSFGDNKLRGLEPHARFQCEMLRTAGLLAVFGVLNLVPGVYNLILATIDGQDWSGNSDVFPPVVLHISALVQVGRRLELSTELVKLNLRALGALSALVACTGYFLEIFVSGCRHREERGARIFERHRGLGM